MKKIILSIIFMIVMTTQAHADYYIDLRNESGTVLHTYTVTTAEVEHMQKNADVQKRNLILKFGDMIRNFVYIESETNKERWRENNAAFVDAEARK